MVPFRQTTLQGIEELVTDKGYHRGAVVQRVKSYAVRSYIPEKKQKGRRDWQDKRAEQQAVYANRRRVRGEYGKSLLRRRRELIERSFAHCYDTGGMRRCHLRGRQVTKHKQFRHGLLGRLGPGGGPQSDSIEGRAKAA